MTSGAAISSSDKRSTHPRVAGNERLVRMSFVNSAKKGVVCSTRNGGGVQGIAFSSQPCPSAALQTRVKIQVTEYGR